MVPSKELKGEENTHQPLRHLMPNCNLFDSISNPSLRWIAIANEKIRADNFLNKICLSQKCMTCIRTNALKMVRLLLLQLHTGEYFAMNTISLFTSLKRTHVNNVIHTQKRKRTICYLQKMLQSKQNI